MAKFRLTLRGLLKTGFIPAFFICFTQFLTLTTCPAADRPNILLFIADDMTWRDCEPYGNPDVRTPNLQRLAGEGMCFDNMFTSTAMCAPTRQQLYTGLWPVRNGAYPNHSQVHHGVKSMVHYFGDAGYRVALAGKTHIGPVESFPFEYYDAFEGGRLETAEFTDVLRDTTKQPFFLVYAHNDPHTPYDHGDPGQYDPDSLEVPEYLIDCPETRKQLTRYYGEITYMDYQFGLLLDYMDSNKLSENTIVIFTSEQGSSFPFAKWTCYENGLKTAFIIRWPGHVEPRTRNSALAQYVDVVPTLLQAVCIDPDTVDTGIADAAGQTGFDGKSFLKLLNGEKKHRRYVYGVHTTRGIISGSEAYPVRSVRSRRFKYIINLNHEEAFTNICTVNDLNNPELVYRDWIRRTRYDPAGLMRVSNYQFRPEVEFYALSVDPYELNNLAEEKKYRRQMKWLSIKLEKWMEQQGDEGMETEMKADERIQ